MIKLKCKIGLHQLMRERIRIHNAYRWITYCQKCDQIISISEPYSSWQMKLANPR
jgi:hypothetical protein